MAFKNDEFKMWLAEEKSVDINAFWNWSQEERAKLLQEFMEVKKGVKNWKFSTEELAEFINSF